MVDRGFGLEMESTYGEIIPKTDFDLDFWNQAEDVDFNLGDEPVTKSGGSRMNKRARAGIMKPEGSTTADADLQQLAWYFRAYLDNYKYTAGSSETVHTHEYWGGECKELPSFRGMAVYDTLIKYLYGVQNDSLSLEVSDENMTVSADWIYKTEKADIIGFDGATFTRPDELTNEHLFIMFYDVSLKMGTDNQGNLKALDGVSTQFQFEGNNNHDVDSTIGMGSRAPQKRAQAGKRENSINLTTSLTSDTVRSILDAQYGEINALEPSACKLLQVPLEVTIAHCEDADIYCKILFPKCTLRVEYDMSGVDIIEATLILDTLGSGVVTLDDGTTEVETDMYIKLVNNQEEIVAHN
jgi:hypothetical protein